MKLASRTRIVLFTLATGLLLFIVFFERGTVSTGEREGRKGRILESFVRARVSRLELQRKGKTTVLTHVAVKDDDPLDAGGWRVVQPYAARADQATVDSLLGALEWIEPRRSLGQVTPKELAEFGLNQPRYRVSFLVGTERFSFSIGATAADGGSYLQVQGKPLAYVVGKDVVEALDREPADFHGKELHDGVSTLTAQALEIADASGARRVEKRDGQYWLKRPFVSLASTPVVTGVINALDGLRASRFISATASTPTEYGLVAPRLTLSLDSLVFDKSQKTKKSRIQTITLRVGGPCQGHDAESYVRVGDGSVFCAADPELAKLLVGAEALRETRVLPLEDAEIHGVELRAGQTAVVLEESGSAVTYRLLDHDRETKRGKVDPDALTEWYKSLRALTIERFDTGTEQAKPRAEAVRVTFQRGKTQAPYTLRLFDDPSGLSAQRLDETALLRLPAPARELLSVSAARFRAKRVLDEDETHFSKLVLSRSGNVSETVVKGAAGYQLSGPCVAAVQRTSIDEILRLATKLEVVRFVADSAVADHGFAAPYRQLRLEYGGDHVHTLELGAVAGDQGRYARLAGDPNVFVVSNALVQKLEDPLVSRDALALPLDDITSFELSSSRRQLRVERRGAAFALTSEPDDAARAERLARVLATLHAARVVSYGKAAAAERLDKPELRVSATLRDGRRVTLEFGAAAPSAPTSPEVFLRRSDLDVSFQVPRSTLDALLERQAATIP